MHTTSASLLMRLREPGQSDAWSRFVRLYSPMLYSWACRMGLQDADAADLVQEVFATLVKKLPKFDYDNHRRFRGWLFTITRNKLRERWRGHPLPLEDQKDPDKLAVPIHDNLEETDFRDYLLRKLIPRFEDQFQPLTWQAFWQHVVEGKSPREVADNLGIGLSAVSMAKVRVLARLHQELPDLLEDV